MPWHETQEWLDDTGSGIWYRLLPTTLADRILGPTPASDTHRAVREAASRAIEQELTELRTAIQRTEKHCTPVTDIDDFPETTDSIRTRFAALREQRQASVDTVEETVTDSIAQHGVELFPADDDYLELYLTAAELDELDRLDERIGRLESHLAASETLATELPEHERRFATIEDDLGELATYDRYLPTAEQRRLNHTLAELEAALSDLWNRLETSVLAPGDRDRLDALASKIEYAQLLISDYNDGDENPYLDGFVAHECATQTALFTDVDDDGNDLNPAQRRAVVRNDAANQVVAAAGTGKTVVLTFRVAYLVAQQGVDPDQIACLTYTKQAKREMERRLEERFGITDVDVSTIHAFSFDIATDSLDGRVEVADDEDRLSFVRETIRDETDDADSDLTTHYKQYLCHHDDERAREEEFDTKEDYLQARQHEQYHTLLGEEVASYAEKVIANFLTRHQVTYEHESRAEWAETAEDKNGYNPDFYLPDYDIYIEHWGIDEDATVAEWFTWSSEEYLDKLRWARGQYEGSDTPELIDTYEFEHQHGTLEAVLRHRLEVHGVELDELSYRELVTEVFDYNKVRGRIHKQLSAFLTNAKVFDIALDDIETALDPADPRQYHFGRCGQFLLREYNAWLDRTGQMAFADMVTKAHEAIRADPSAYRDRYDHVMVDEFQDVSESQVTLLQLLTDSPDGPRLFAVGDDWQSIYSFQGSQVDYFVDFEEYFSHAEKTFLTKNYRCPQSVLDAGNELIAHNDSQISKTVTAESPVETTPELHVLGGSDDEYTTTLIEYAANLVEQYLGSWPDESDATTPSDVMVLCHYDNGAPYMDGLKTELRSREIPYDGKEDFYRPDNMPGQYSSEFDDEAGVTVFSIHQAKGREAEHVIVLHAADDDLGIPNDRSDTLLDPVQPIDIDSEPEDRRLFYVALTRAEATLDVLTRAGHRSTFVDEIADTVTTTQTLSAFERCGDSRIDTTVRVETLYDDSSEKKHQAGKLTDLTSHQRPFVTWQNDVDEDSLPTLRADQWFELGDVRLSEYNGTVEILLDEQTTADAIAPPVSPDRSTAQTVKVERLFDDIHDKKYQDGYLRTTSGQRRRLVSWQTDHHEPDPPTLREGEWYLLDGYQRDEFNGERQFVVGTETDVVHTDPPTADVRVAAVYDDISDKLEQKGKLELDGFEAEFVSWADSDAPTLTESKRYSLDDFDYNEYNGTLQVVLHDGTTATPN